MRRFSRFLVVATSLAMVAVAGQASAGQARPRSAPPSSSSGSSGSGSGSSSQPSQSSRESSRPQAQRREAPPQSSVQQQPRVQQQPQARQQPQQQPRVEQMPRAQQQPRNDPRNDPRNGGGRGGDNRNVDPRGNGGREYGRVEPQPQMLPRYDTQRQAIPAPRDRYIDLNRNGRDDRNDNNRNYGGNYGGNYYGGSSSFRNNGYYPTYRGNYSPSYRYSGLRIVIAPRYYQRFSSSWYSFRPQLRLSFGLTLGYPVSFPTWYDPYIVGNPGYTRPYMAYGGVSFDVEPQDADLWVDGEYVGRVSDYTSYDPPLTLVAGRHHIEISRGDYRAVEFDITVISGQVIPYQGTLPYYR